MLWESQGHTQHQGIASPDLLEHRTILATLHAANPSSISKTTVPASDGGCAPGLRGQGKDTAPHARLGQRAAVHAPGQQDGWRPLAHIWPSPIFPASCRLPAVLTAGKARTEVSSSGIPLPKADTRFASTAAWVRPRVVRGCANTRTRYILRKVLSSPFTSCKPRGLAQ